MSIIVAHEQLDISTTIDYFLIKQMISSIALYKEEKNIEKYKKEK